MASSSKVVDFARIGGVAAKGINFPALAGHFVEEGLCIGLAGTGPRDEHYVRGSMVKHKLRDASANTTETAGQHVGSIRIQRDLLWLGREHRHGVIWIDS